MIKAIETVYNGYRFRSRLEARWAVFFDALGVRYEYEPEGYDIDGTWYLPDFWLPDWRAWVEIKPIRKKSRKAYEEFDKTILALKIGLNGEKCIKLIFLGQPGKEFMFVSTKHMFMTYCTACHNLALAVGDYEEDNSNKICIITNSPLLACTNPSCLLSTWNTELEFKFRQCAGIDAYFKCFDERTKKYIPPKGIVHAYTAARQARFEHSENGRRK